MAFLVNSASFHWMWKGSGGALTFKRLKSDRVKAREMSQQVLLPAVGSQSLSLGQVFPAPLRAAIENTWE